MNQVEEPGVKRAGDSEDDLLALLEKNVDATSAVDQPGADQQRASHRFIHSVGRTFETPAFFVVIALVVSAWIGVNQFGGSFGLAAFDPPPFPWLQGIISLSSLTTAAVVLVRQSGMANRDRRRDRMGLQLAILTEQKVAKVISLLEELRRDSPEVGNRHDHQADVLGTAVHPEKVLDTIKRKLDNKE